MKGKIVIKILLGGLSLSTLSAKEPSQESWLIQELRLSFENLEYKLHSHQTEIALLRERMSKVELEKKSLVSQDNSFLEKRISKLEHMEEGIVADLKKLKGHLTTSQAALAECQKKLENLDKQLSMDVKTLKASLQSMLALLQSDVKEKVYTVAPGDTLGQIALDHHTDIKTLKQLNQMTADTIYPGQKLTVPGKS